MKTSNADCDGASTMDCAFVKPPSHVSCMARYGSSVLAFAATSCSTLYDQDAFESYGTADLPEPERNARILMVSAAF